MRRMLILALVGATALTACSSSGSTTESLRAKRASASAPTTTSTGAPFVSASEHTPGSLAHFVGARADVHDTSCAARDGGWTAKGRVTNPTTSRVRYRVYASFLNGDTTVGLAESNIGPVAPKATEDWSAAVRVHATGLRCILRVERAAA